MGQCDVVNCRLRVEVVLMGEGEVGGRQRVIWKDSGVVECRGKARVRRSETGVDCYWVVLVLVLVSTFGVVLLVHLRWGGQCAELSWRLCVGVALVGEGDVR